MTRTRGNSSIATMVKLLVMLCGIMCSVSLFAQGRTITSRGVAGDMDRDERNPELSVTREVSEGSVKLLVDAHIPHPDFREHPLEFEFYINRKFLTKQVRSKDLPGPVGVVITPDIAGVPFTYTVIARVLHPNRTFTTMVSGTAFGNELGGSFDCKLTLTSATIENGDEVTESTDVFEAKEVPGIQQSNNSFNISIEASKTDGDEDVTITGAVNTEGEDGVSAVLSIERDGKTTTVATTGTASTDDDRVKSFTLSNDEEGVKLECS